MPSPQYLGMRMSDASTLRQARRETRIKRRDQLALLGRVMAEPIGREFFYDLLASCHVYSTSFATNALAMAFREGERNVGLRLAADLTEATPDLFLLMLKEQNNVRSREPESESESGTDESES
jgi:hypothetical protein